MVTIGVLTVPIFLVEKQIIVIYCLFNVIIIIIIIIIY